MAKRNRTAPREYWSENSTSCVVDVNQAVAGANHSSNGEADSPSGIVRGCIRNGGGRGLFRGRGSGFGSSR